MYKELLKQHEEILKNLTDKASKETDFNERGQFINIQKMIDMEIKFIERLKELKDTSDDSNKLCAYKLGVGKILIGQRRSGISSTLIDECLKYNRPLIVGSKHRAEQLSKQYPKLRLCFLIRDFNKNGYGVMNTNEEVINLDKEQVNIDLQVGYNINKDIAEKTKEIKQIVGTIGTVGVSYELEEEQPIWFPIANEIPKVVESDKSTDSLTKYVYVYFDCVEDSKFKMIYFNNFECMDMLSITNVRHFKSADDICDALFVAKSLGYKPILNNMSGGALLCNVLDNTLNNCITKSANADDYSNAYIRFAKGNMVITHQSKESEDAINSFDEKCMMVENGRFKYIPKVEDDNSSLFKELVLAIHLIKEDNK